MKEERNALQKEVFPKLRKLCMEHGFRFQAIDLRWGVSEEAGLDQQTMKICLEEIERSQRVSPKPNFIVLLGDRYGWRPLPYEIPADEFEEIKKVVSPSDKDFLFWEGDVLKEDQLKKREGWYCRDENAIPLVYCLKPRLVDYEQNDSDEEIKEARDLEYKDWENIEKRLKSILLNAINDLSWDNNDPRRFKYESSATEQEIIKGVLKLPEDGSLSEEHIFSFMRTIKNKKHISFDDYSKDFFDFTAAGTTDLSAEEKLIALKDKIDDKLPSSNIFDYETEWEGNGVSKQHIEKLCDDVHSSLEKVINEQINEFEEKDPLDVEIEAHKEFGEERCRFFMGREDNRAQIKNYLENPNSKPLIVYGVSGSGKSALMAQAVEDSHPGFYKTPVDNIIFRFIGATPESSDMRSLLESLSRQITRIYGEDDSNIPTEYNDLVQDFKERLDFATPEKPIFIFLDALDQLSDSESTHNLTWIPDELPENVQIVISTLKNIFQSSLEHRYSENTVEVLPLEKNDGRNILEAWFSDNKRKLTDIQETEVIRKFEVEGLPLYLKLAFEESKLWKSYNPVPELESGIKWMINNLFERLSLPENHGEILVSKSLGYLSAAKTGLTEDEMLDILALDDDVFNLTKIFHEPTEDKLPVALWSRLYFDLESYLTERSADETTLLAFYHKQLGEVAGEKYLDNTVKKSRHQLIAEYFYRQDLYFDLDEERVYNVRKVSELPYQETYGECWKSLEDTLCDLRFVEAKCAMGRTYDLIRDYNLVLDMHPDAQEEKQKRLVHEKRVDKYVKDLIVYSKGEIDHLDIISSIKPLSEEDIRKDIERIINNPNPSDRIKEFSQFVNSQSHALAEFGSLSGFCIQKAYNYANTGSVSENASKILNENLNVPLILRDEKWLPDYNRSEPSLIKTLECHPHVVYAVAVTPDGKKAITGSGDQTVKVWDLETGENTKTFQSNQSTVFAVAVTPDGKRAITGSYDKTVRVWDLETGENTKTLQGHTHPVEAVAVTPDGKRAISGCRDNTVRVWDLETGENTKTLEYLGLVQAVAVTPDGKKGIIGDDYRLIIWDLETNTNKTLKGHKKSIHAVVVTPDGQRVITGSYDKTLIVWDLKTCEQIKTIEGYIREISSLDVTPDGKRAIIGGRDNTVRVWDLETGENTKTLQGHIDSVEAVAITPDGKRAITGSRDKTVKVWDLETGENTKILQGHTDAMRSVIIIHGKSAIKGSGDKTVKVWDLETGENTKDSVEAVAITPDGKRAITGNTDGNTWIWDLETGIKTKKIKRYTNKLFESLEHKSVLIDSVYSVDVTCDGKKAIIGSSYHTPDTLQVYDLDTGTQLQNLQNNSNEVYSVVVTPDGKRVITGSRDKTVKVWDLETGENTKTLQGHTDAVKAVAITPDGKRVITGSYDKTLIVWDLKTCEQIKTIEGYMGEISSLVVTPDGKRVITGSGDKTVKVWDLETGENTKTLQGHTDAVEAVAITPDGKRAITGSRDKTVRVWDLETKKMISISNEDNPILSLKLKTEGSFVFGCGNDVIYSHLVNVPLAFPLTTARRIWLFMIKRDLGTWDDKISADCLWCGNRFEVSDEILNDIREIEKEYKTPNGWISDEAWEDQRLISECPECHKKLKFNPFIVDNKPKSRWKFWK
jgi:WD40 repeat protein